MPEQEDKPIFNADFIRKIQAETLKNKEEEKHFADIFGIEKHIFENMMAYIQQRILNKVDSPDTEVTVHVTDAYTDSPYWVNTKFRTKLSNDIETNYSKISMGFHSKLEALGFKVEAKSIDTVVESVSRLQVKEIELKISW